MPGENPLGARTRTNNKLNPHMTLSPGIEPGPHWWEASALATAPSLLPDMHDNHKLYFRLVTFLKRGLLQNFQQAPNNFS